MPGIGLSFFDQAFFGTREAAYSGPPYDDFESYTSDVELGGLDGGVFWPAAWVDSTNSLGTKARDTFEAYSSGVSIEGLNKGTGWSGAWTD